MDPMMVLSSKKLLLGRNIEVGGHKFISPDLVVPILGNARANQVGICSLSSLRSNGSYTALQRGQMQSQPHRDHGVRRSRKVTSSTIFAGIESPKVERPKDYEINGKVVLEGMIWLESEIYLELISSDLVDPGTGFGKTAGQFSSVNRGDRTVKLKWNSALGFPGAFRIKSKQAGIFLLKSLTISIPDQGEVRFQCNSWIFQDIDRVFFSIKSFLPEETPMGLRKLRVLDMKCLRGDGTGERKESDLIYDYDVYNDLGQSEKDPELRRKVLGGSQDFPYPRRCRTGRLIIGGAPGFETRAFSIFIPPDERSIIPKNFSRPQIMGDECAWRSDEEFGRQILAGINPMMIQCLQKFPPSSSLDEKLYGPQKSAITAQQIEKKLEGLSADQATTLKRLFIVDYYDTYMPYVDRINKLSSDLKTYASRTIYFLTTDGTLTPVAIELCLPPIDENVAVRRVFIPGEDGTEEGALWELAKAHAKVNDVGYHQLVSHWLRNHCIVEPFIIATHRQLSKMHPVYKLLIPHYLDTMDINQAARQSLINASGIIESGFTPGRYCMELSSKAYKQWKFNEQGLEADLLKRGIAVRDSSTPNGLKLVIEDYPYAVDGIEIWFAIKQWVSEYLSLYYKDDISVKKDNELQAWWDEIVKVGHGDLKDDPSRWYKMDSFDEVVEVMTTIIWTASAHHAAVNFGQYCYGGYMPNLPTMSRRFIPDKGTPEYDEFLQNPDGFFLKTVCTPRQDTFMMNFFEALKHPNNEVYLGQLQGSTMDRVDDPCVCEAFARFSENMRMIQKNIEERNSNRQVYKNRYGPAKVPYTLLYPGKGGLNGGGVPNSISI